MNTQPRVILALLTVTVLSVDCRANAKDDEFARSFIDGINRRDSSVVARFEPGSELSKVGWSNVVTLADRLPPTPADSVRLIEWEQGSDPRIGAYRKLTYLIDRGSKEGRVQLWLVSRSGKTYVNTVRATEMVPATSRGP